MSKAQKHTNALDNALEAITAGAGSPEQNTTLPAQPSATPQPVAEKVATVEAVATTPAPSVAPVRAKRQLAMPRLQLSGYLHNSWDVTVDRDTALTDVLQHDFWVHVANKFKPHDTITVISEDGAWYARLLVINADRLWAKMYLLESHDLTSSYKDMPLTQEEEYDTPWTSLGKYAIVKKNQHGLPPLKDGFQTKFEAFAWLDGHLKTINK